VKTFIVTATLLSLAGLVCAAPDELQDSYTKLKEAVAKKDADGVMAAAAETHKHAQALVTAPKPTDAEEAKGWQERVDYGKEVSTYSEYALATTAAQVGEPAKTIALVDALIAQNPKSRYLDEVCANAYLVALGKSGGSAKQMDGMARIVAGRPDNIVALNALIEGRPATGAQNGARLLVAAKKAKPEGLAEGDWDRIKNSALANGYFYIGFTAGQKQNWKECDTNLKSALPLIANDANKIGTAYFSLAICNYQFGKLTNDRPRMQAGQQYMEKAAGLKGPYQNQAYQQNVAMKQELLTRR
jgi:hypothetical protein